MNAHVTPPRGGAPVGYVAELGAVEAGAVFYLRLWADGAAARQQVQDDFNMMLGSQHGANALRAFEGLYDLCARHGRRPLMRHHVTCKCLGADESCFANFIGYASEGAHDDALMIATTIVRPDVAPILASLAGEFGVALRRLALRAESNSPVHQTLH